MPVSVQRFDRLTWRGPRHFFRVVDSGNNEILAQSQPYKTNLQRNETAQRFAEAFGCELVWGWRK